MFWLILGCSSNDLTYGADYSSEFGSDTGIWNSSPDDDFDEESDVDDTEQPYWWKLFADLHWDTTTQEYSVELSRILYTEQLDIICLQPMESSMITAINSPTGSGAWLQMDIYVSESDDCTFTRDETSINLGVGNLFSDLEIALEMVVWNSNEEMELYSELDPLGGYIIFENTEDVYAFGAAYPEDPQTDMIVDITTGNWLIRPIYSFKW
jgi:hypothetical protein